MSLEVKTNTYSALMVRYTCNILQYTMCIVVYTATYPEHTLINCFQVRHVRAYLDSLSMDGAEVAANCLLSAVMRNMLVSRL